MKKGEGIKNLVGKNNMIEIAIYDKKGFFNLSFKLKKSVKLKKVERKIEKFLEKKDYIDYGKKM